MLNRLHRVLILTPLVTLAACSSTHKHEGTAAAKPAAVNSPAEPAAKPAVQVQFPENWKVEQNGTVASSPDGCSLIVTRVDKKSPADVAANLSQTFPAVFRDATITDTDDTTVNGLKAQKLTGRGHRNERGVRFTAVLIPAQGATATDAVIAVGPETMYKQHMRDIDTALDTIKPVAH